MKGAVYYENAQIGELRPDIITSGRPVIIVTDKPARNVVQVVPLTSSEEKRNDGDPMHVPICLHGRESTALCEQLRTVRAEELRRFPIGICSHQEIKNIDIALRELFGLNYFKEETLHEHE